MKIRCYADCTELFVSLGLERQVIIEHEDIPRPLQWLSVQRRWYRLYSALSLSR